MYEIMKNFKITIFWQNASFYKVNGILNRVERQKFTTEGSEPLGEKYTANWRKQVHNEVNLVLFSRESSWLTV
jgi:Txe/YoeB family toxin of Txe-Axe toxin-antitoxin module